MWFVITSEHRYLTLGELPNESDPLAQGHYYEVEVLPIGEVLPARLSSVNPITYVRVRVKGFSADIAMRYGRLFKTRKEADDYSKTMAGVAVKKGFVPMAQSLSSNEASEGRTKHL